MRSRLIRSVAILSIFAVFGVGQALAAGTWYWYDLTVPGFGGSVPTNNQTKQFNGQATVSSNLIGGNYDLRIRLEKVDNSSLSNWYVINDGTFLRYNNTGAAGQVVHMRLKSDAFDPVNIQANGNWSPDTP